MRDFVITLDIDDCIWINNNTWAIYTDDSMELLVVNLRRLASIVEYLNAKVFITSSWAGDLKLTNNKIEFTSVYPDKPYYRDKNEAMKHIKKYLDGHFIGLSTGNRFKDVELLMNIGYTVINIDDIDMSSISHHNYLNLNVKGLISNAHLYKIHLLKTKKVK